jgi:hypothetical protein
MFYTFCTFSTVCKDNAALSIRLLFNTKIVYSRQLWRVIARLVITNNSNGSFLQNEGQWRVVEEQELQEERQNTRQIIVNKSLTFSLILYEERKDVWRQGHYSTSTFHIWIYLCLHTKQENRVTYNVLSLLALCIHPCLGLPSGLYRQLRQLKILYYET